MVSLTPHPCDCMAHEFILFDEIPDNHKMFSIFHIRAAYDTERPLFQEIDIKASVFLIFP